MLCYIFIQNDIWINNNDTLFQEYNILTYGWVYGWVVGCLG